MCIKIEMIDSSVISFSFLNIMIKFCLKTVENRSNGGPGDWYNMFTLTRFRYLFCMLTFFSRFMLWNPQTLLIIAVRML